MRACVWIFFNSSSTDDWGAQKRQKYLESSDTENLCESLNIRRPLAILLVEVQSKRTSNRLRALTLPLSPNDIRWSKFDLAQDPGGRCDAPASHDPLWLQGEFNVHPAAPLRRGGRRRDGRRGDWGGVKGEVGREGGGLGLLGGQQRRHSLGALLVHRGLGLVSDVDDRASPAPAAAAAAAVKVGQRWCL